VFVYKSPLEMGAPLLNGTVVKQRAVIYFFVDSRH